MSLDPQKLCPGYSVAVGLDCKAQLSLVAAAGPLIFDSMVPGTEPGPQGMLRKALLLPSVDLGAVLHADMVAWRRG